MNLNALKCALQCAQPECVEEIRALVYRMCHKFYFKYEIKKSYNIEFGCIG